MSAIVLNLKGLNDLEIEAKLRALATAQTNNPTAATGLTITSVELLAAADLIETKRNLQAAAEAAAGAATANKQAAVAAGKELIADYAPEVWRGTNKDTAKCTLLGFDLRGGVGDAPAPPPHSGQITGLTLSFGAHAGELRVESDPMPRMYSMEVQINTTPNAAPTWQHASISSASSCTLSGLVPGSLVQVRVRAIFAGGTPGPWSDIAEHRVP
jgi:hypothetical protein